VTEKPQQQQRSCGVIVICTYIFHKRHQQKKEKRFVRIKKNGAKESRLKNKNRRGARKHYTKGDG